MLFAKVNHFWWKYQLTSNGNSISLQYHEVTARNYYMLQLGFFQNSDNDLQVICKGLIKINIKTNWRKRKFLEISYLLVFLFIFLLENYDFTKTTVLWTDIKENDHFFWVFKTSEISLKLVTIIQKSSVSTVCFWFIYIYIYIYIYTLLAG